MTVALPPKARAIAYYTLSVVGLGLTATQAGFAAAAIDQPVWLAVAWAVFGTLSAGVGVTAATNTDLDDTRELARRDID